MKHLKILAGLVVLMLLSCEKNIDIELPETEQKIVVEGSIEPGQPPLIILSKTQGYFSPIDTNSLRNTFVHNASIQVSNGTVSVTLIEICTDQLPDSLLPPIAELIGVSVENIKRSGICIYSTTNPSIFGVIGEAYDLTIDVEGKKLTSTTTIPVPVPMERYWYKDQPGYPDFGYLWFKLNDPPELGNYYRFYTKRIGKDNRFLPTNGSIFDDEFFNGLNFEGFVYRGRDIHNKEKEFPVKLRDYFKQGDTIAIKFCTIDQAHFKFLQTFEIASFNNGNPFAAPATIQSNITGGIGVWGGYGVVYDTLIAED